MSSLFEKPKAGVVPFLLLLCLLVSGCGRKPFYPLPSDGVSRFPTGEALEEGDIILCRSFGLVGAMFANHSIEGGRFSHGAMVYRNDCGRLMMLNYRPTGMETCTPEEFFTRYNRLALVRYNGGMESARAPDYVGAGLVGKEAISATSRYWLSKNEETRIPPDYHLDHDDHESMFCIELTSTVYRDCGLPEPFFISINAEEDPLMSKGLKLFKTNVVEIRSPSGVLHNPEFRLVSEWLKPDFDLREEALNEEVIQVLVDDVKGGLEPKRPNVMGRLKLKKVFLLYHLITKSMFWKPKQDIPDFIDGEVIENAYMMYSYAAAAKKAAKQRMLESTEAVFEDTPGGDETLRAVRRIVREECGKRRDTYLSPMGRKAGKAVKSQCR